jgi:hypothetical protein
LLLPVLLICSFHELKKKKKKSHPIPATWCVRKGRSSEDPWRYEELSSRHLLGINSETSYPWGLKVEEAVSGLWRDPGQKSSGHLCPSGLNAPRDTADQSIAASL